MFMAASLPLGTLHEWGQVCLAASILLCRYVSAVLHLSLCFMYLL